MTPSRALAAAKQRIGQTVDGKYRLKSVLGVGGMGIVYEADHLFLSRTVALKILHPRYEDTQEGATRFLKEARAAGAIGHHAIVQVMDAGFVDGLTPYLVMEYLVGENVDERIKRRHGIRVKQAALILREMMKGLSAAHAKGVIHCDLKPANVFLIDRTIEPGHVKILDFGISKIASESLSARTESGEHVLGTPEYMAPEQVSGGEVSVQTDLYAAGAVIFESLEGHPPFEGASRVEIFVRILREQAEPILGKRERVPIGLASIVHKLLSKEPKDRPETAADVVRAIDALEMLPHPTSSSKLPAAKKRE